MAASEVNIEADADGKPLSVLSDLIRRRAEVLKNETTEKAVIATTINVVTSIKAETKKAPLKAKPDMFEVRQVGVGKWRRMAGKSRRIPFVGEVFDDSIHPVNLMRGLRDGGILYRISLTNPNIRPKSSKNAPYYYVLAPTLGVATDYAKARVGRALQKESGMARYALGMAQARASDRPMMSDGSVNGSHAMQVAAQAAVVTSGGSGFGQGTYWMEVNDKLRYSTSALRSGDASLDLAIKKAANRTAAIINHMADVPLDQKLETPFPEVAGRGK